MYKQPIFQLGYSEDHHALNVKPLVSHKIFLENANDDYSLPLEKNSIIEVNEKDIFRFSEKNEIVFLMEKVAQNKIEGSDFGEAFLQIDFIEHRRTLLIQLISNKWRVKKNETFLKLDDSLVCNPHDVIAFENFRIKIIPNPKIKKEEMNTLINEAVYIGLDMEKLDHLVENAIQIFPKKNVKNLGETTLIVDPYASSFIKSKVFVKKKKEETNFFPDVKFTDEDVKKIKILHGERRNALQVRKRKLPNEENKSKKPKL